MTRSPYQRPTDRWVWFVLAVGFVAMYAVFCRPEIAGFFG